MAIFKCTTCKLYATKMSTSGPRIIFNFLLCVLLMQSTVLCWDNDDLELFDLVEEVNENFYELLGVTTAATSSEIKRAYRKKTLILHPDKNEAEDAEEKFRQLVAVYEILKDDEKREKYNLVLENGLPDWRQPVFYYRKARKLGLAELALLLAIIITIGHYFVMWAVYLERRLALEDFFESKRKRETKGKKGKAAMINEKLEEDMHETLESIPKPQFSRLWPVTMTVWLCRTVVSLPVRIKERKERIRQEEERKKIEQEEKERLEALYKEELEQRKLKRSMKKSEPEFAPLSESASTPVVYGLVNNTDDGDSEAEFRQTIKDGAWTDEDYVLLSKAYIKFPGGTLKRWDKIAEFVGRPVNEVTAKCKQMKGNFQMNLSSAVQAGTKNSRNQFDFFSDEIISKPQDETVTAVTTDQGEDNTVRRRQKHKTVKDAERTLLITENATKDSLEIKQTGLPVSSQNTNTQQTVNQSKENLKSSKIPLKKTKSENKMADSKKKNTEEKMSENQAIDADQWSQNQQVVLEWALKQYPKGTDQRWEKIAEQVPFKTKEECMLRFKYLADLIKQKKQQQS